MPGWSGKASTIKGRKDNETAWVHRDLRFKTKIGHICARSRDEMEASFTTEIRSPWVHCDGWSKSCEPVCPKIGHTCLRSRDEMETSFTTEIRLQLVICVRLIGKWPTQTDRKQPALLGFISSWVEKLWPFVWNKTRSVHGRFFSRPNKNEKPAKLVIYFFACMRLPTMNDEKQRNCSGSSLFVIDSQELWILCPKSVDLYHTHPPMGRNGSVSRDQTRPQSWARPNGSEFVEFTI